MKTLNTLYEASFFAITGRRGLYFSFHWLCILCLTCRPTKQKRKKLLIPSLFKYLILIDYELCCFSMFSIYLFNSTVLPTLDREW